ncbi:MAG: HAMP domain-containing protein [Mesorhizobium sp.]|nr:HAMP domain-containing protein [Mesorhizobium sp.]
MKIGSKIYAIVGLMGLVAVAIGGMAVYTLNEYNARLAALENVSERAYLGERLNRYVTAVVMDARGIYASSSTEQAEQFGKGLYRSLDQMDALLAQWRPLVDAEGLADFNAVVDRSAEFRAFRAETARLGTEVSPAEANIQGNNEQNRANRKAFQAEIDAVVNRDQQILADMKVDLASFQTRMAILIGSVVLVGLAAGAGAAAYIGTAQLSRPIRGLTGTMKMLADGNLEADIPFAGRKDEIGEMAKAVEVFKQNALKVRELNAQEAALQAKSADLQTSIAEVVASAVQGNFDRRITKDYQDADLNRFAASVNELVTSVDTGIAEVRRVVASLAEGDLTQSMNGNFQGAFEELQHNVNSTMQTLRSVLRDVRITSDTIGSNTVELRSAADDLSRRTEQQAASLEETSAALDEITATVRESTDRAQEASRMVDEARRSTEQSTKVVAEAVSAMSRIEQASGEIGQIISLIDEIAFQTNLLALNAGVEAARAGEAGRGFAVVAQEVRELAQRSATAAKDIKDLITKSGEEVSTGVRLVTATGEALDTIQAHVVHINEHVHSIASAAGEQSTGLSEINTAMNQMDQVTQRNAAMVEETTAATHRLSSESASLTQLISHFKVEGGASVREADDYSASVPSPARVLGQRVAGAFGGVVAAE